MIWAFTEHTSPEQTAFCSEDDVDHYQEETVMKFDFVHMSKNEIAQHAKRVLCAVAALRGIPTVSDRLDAGTQKTSAADLATDDLIMHHGNSPTILAGTEH